MSQIASICRAVDFVEAHLKEEIAVADMADAAGYSLYHFCRTFNGLVHHTPYDYLMRRRLSESARELLETDKRIIDIAFDYCFNSPETYSRAFKRMFGVQPSQWKEQGRLDRRFLMSPLTPEHLEHVNEGEYLRPVLEERDAFRVAGLMTLVDDGGGAIPRLWEVLAQELKNAEDAEYYGITWYPAGWEESGVFYMAGIEVEAMDSVNPALVVKSIPPLKCARFTHRGSRSDLRFMLDYIYQAWLPKSGEHLAYPLEIACYGRDMSAAWQDAESEVYISIE
ncbi:MAG: AraC family transcriptional regulator [Anaerolineae bacterium]|nr:AraC family transcriptional regulator [Anaerolineae bacterium]